MTQQLPRSTRRLDVPSNRSRELDGRLGDYRTEWDVTLYEDSRLIVKGGNLALKLTYAGRPGGDVHVYLASGTTVWIASWQSSKSAATVFIEIGPHAHLGLSEEALTVATSIAPFEIAFSSKGTGGLVATWEAGQSSPPLHITGTSPGDRLNLAMRNDVDRTIEPLFVTSEPSLAASSDNASLLSMLHEHSTAQFKQMIAASAFEPLPIGVEASCWNDSGDQHVYSPLKPTLGYPRRSDPRVTDALLFEYFRAQVAPSEWERIAPIIFQPSALAPGIPQRRVALAPGQCVRTNGKTVLARQLVNGISIVQHSNGHYVCYVMPPILTKDDAVFAGLNLAGTAQALISSHDVEQCRQQMLVYTLQQHSVRLDAIPALRLEIGGLSIKGERDTATSEVWRFALPSTVPPGVLCVASRSSVARDTTPLPLTDIRILGIALCNLVIRGLDGTRSLDLSHPSWTGLHPWEFRRGRAMRWTNGLATLPYEAHGLQGGETIELHVASIGRYWIDSPQPEPEDAA